MGRNAANDREAAAARARKETFLRALRGEYGTTPKSVAAAAKQAGVERSTVRKWNQDDPVFKEAYDDAFEDGTDIIEDAAIGRAVNGVSTPVYQGGIHVGDKQVYSDGLMQMVLAGRRPERYRTGFEVNTNVNTNNLNAALIDDAQLARAFALLIAQNERKQLNGKDHS